MIQAHSLDCVSVIKIILSEIMFVKLSDLKLKPPSPSWVWWVSSLVSLSHSAMSSDRWHDTRSSAVVVLQSR